MHKVIVYSHAQNAGMSADESIYEPRGVENLYEASVLNSFVDSTYAYALTTMLTVQPDVLFAASNAGILHTAPLWFTQSVYGSTRQAERMAREAIQGTLEVCGNETKALRDAYETQLEETSASLEAIRAENAKLREALGRVRLELKDVQDRVKASPDVAVEADDVETAVEQAEEIVRVSQEQIQDASNKVEQIPRKAEESTTERMYSLADQLRLQKENLQKVVKEETVSGEPVSDTLTGVLAKAIAVRRAAIVGAEEEEEEDFDWEDIGMRIATRIPHSYVPESFVPVPRRSVMPSSSRRRSEKKPSEEESSLDERSRSREITMSPTRAYFGDTYDLLPWTKVVE